MCRYKTKYKSIWSNLKNYVQNSQLGEKLLMGVLVAAKIVTMTPQDMASDEMRKSRQVREVSIHVGGTRGVTSSTGKKYEKTCSESLGLLNVSETCIFDLFIGCLKDKDE